MSLRFGGLAPDLLGGVALANALARGGCRVTLGIDAAATLPPGADAAVLVMPRAAGVAEALRGLDALVQRGVSQVLLLSDYLPVGSDDLAGFATLAEAVSRRLDAGLTVLVPASPAARQTLYRGQSFLGDALQGGAHGGLPDALRRSLAGALGTVSFEVVQAGAAAVRREVSRLAEGGRRYALVDSLTPAHLEAVAEAVAGQPLLLVSAEMAMLLAARGEAAAMEPDTIWPPTGGRAAILVSGSSRSVLAQVGAARDAMPVVEIDLLRDGDDEAVLAKAGGALADAGDAPVVVISAALPPDRRALAVRRWDEDEVEQRHRGVLAALTRQLHDAGLRKFLGIGAAASDALVAALDVASLELGAELAEGLSWMRHGDTWLCLSDGERGGRLLLRQAFEE